MISFPNRPLLAALLVVWALAEGANAELTCHETAERHAVHLAGEIAGNRSYRQPVGNRWTFTLLRQERGWAIRLKARDGIDLTQVTPPFRGPNPRDIEGWHFRNASNTAANDGSVNAPRELRIFQFSPGLEGTGGFRPPSGTAIVDAVGRGWFKIDDYALADLEPDQQARMMYLKFFACLTWPKSTEEIAEETDRNSPAHLDEEIEIFGSCGLARMPHKLHAYVLPRTMDGDLDGDGSIDYAAPAIRTTDGKAGFVICRAGTYLHLIGFDAVVGELAPAYFETIEGWAIKPRSAVPAYEGSPPLPDIKHDVLTIERIEKSSYTIYWDGKTFRSRLDYRFVEGQ